jgi:hypothetical protein
VDHPGSIADFGNLFVMAPDEGVAVMMLFNHAVDFWGAAGQLVSHIFDQLLDLPDEITGPQVVEPDRSLWPLYTGIYLDQHHGLATILVQDDRLILDWNDALVPLQALRRDLYFGQNPDSQAMFSVSFVLEEEGPAQYVYVRFPGHPAACKRIEHAAPFALDPSAWAAYIGTYAGETITMTVRLRDGYLAVYSKKHNVEVRCIPLDHSRFASAYGLIEFQAQKDTLQLGGVVTLRRVKETP